MSFWDVANGRQSDVELPPLPNYAKEVVAPYTRGALGVATIAGLAVAAFYTRNFTIFNVARVMAVHGGKGISEEFHNASSAEENFANDLERAKAERVRACIRYFSRAVQKNKTNAVAFFKLAQLYQANDQLESALDAVNKAIDIKSNDVSYLMLLGVLLLQLERKQDAVEAFLRVVLIDPNHYYAWCNLGVAYSSTGNEAETDRCWREACRINPDEPLAWANRATIHDRKMEYEAAAECWQNAANANSQIVPPWQASYDAGQTNLSQGKFLEALEHYENALKYKPEWIQAKIGKALCLQHTAGSQAAMNEFLGILALDPNNVIAHFNLGNIADGHGQHDDAKMYWLRAFKLDPKCKVPWVRAYDRSQEHFRAGHNEAYLHELTRALELYPEYTLAWFEKGLLHYSMKDMQRAENCWLRVVELDPTHASAWVRIGNRRVEQGEMDSALICWTKALNHNPNIGEAWLKKGAVLADRGETEEALMCFEKAASCGHLLAPKAVAMCRFYNSKDIVGDLL